MISSQRLIDSVRLNRLSNSDASTWSDSVLIVALNQALQMLALIRPDATAKTAAFPLIKGARQSLPDDGLRLLSVVCNIDPVTMSPTQVIRLVQKEDMDSASYSWLTAIGSIVREYVYDARNPKQFFIYPNVPVGSLVEIEYSATPSHIESGSIEQDIAIDAVYSQPLQELMLYKLLSGGINDGQSDKHFLVAMNLLGVKDAQDERLSSARKTEV